MRRNQTSAELLLWAAIRRRALGHAVHRQAVLLGWIVDFWCPAKRLIIEVDGVNHQQPKQKVRDDLRTAVLERRLGAKVIRVTNEEVDADLPAVVERVKAEVGSRPTFRSWNQKVA